MIPSLRSLFVVLAGVTVACGSGDGGGGDAVSYGPVSPSTPDNPTSDADLPAAPFCESLTTNDPARERFAALTPEPRPAYISMRSAPDDGAVVTVAERGQLCGDASDAAKCKAAYDALQPRREGLGRPFSGVTYLHCYTRGDAVGCIETVAEAIAFLGPIKSIEEAFWLAELAGYYPQCTNPEVVARGTKLGDGSFQIATMVRREHCGPLLRAVVNVKPNGEIREVDVRKIPSDTGCGG